MAKLLAPPGVRVFILKYRILPLPDSFDGFKTALETNRFRSVDERATALLMMAQLDLRSHNNEGAKRYLREAKALEPGEQVREQISMIVKQARLRL